MTTSSACCSLYPSCHLTSGQSFAPKRPGPWSTTLLASQLSALKDHGWETGEDRLDHLMRLTEAHENCTWNTLRSTKVLLNRQNDLNVPYNIPINVKNTFETSLGTRASITRQRVHHRGQTLKSSSSSLS